MPREAYSDESEGNPMRGRDDERGGAATDGTDAELEPIRGVLADSSPDARTFRATGSTTSTHDGAFI